MRPEPHISNVRIVTLPRSRLSNVRPLSSWPQSESVVVVAAVVVAVVVVAITIVVVLYPQPQLSNVRFLVS